jgi:CRISPR locus-related DNA-binding protein
MNVITTLGFDISHIMLVITKSGVKPSKIIVLVGTIKDEVDQRVETAYTMLKQFATMINVKIERIEIDVTEFDKSVEEILKILEENIPAILDIGGGLRLLVIETYTAYTMLSPTKMNNITLYTVLEGRNELIHIDLKTLKKRIATNRILNDTYKAVLKIIEEKGIATPKEILEQLNRDNPNKITKQYLSKLLARLVDLGLVEKIERGKYKYKP